MSEEILIDLTELDQSSKYVVPEGERVAVRVEKADYKNGVSAKGRAWHLISLQTVVVDPGGEHDGKWVYGGIFLGATNPMLENILEWNGYDVPYNDEGKLILTDALNTLPGCVFGCTVVNEKREKTKTTIDPETGQPVVGETYTVTDNKVKEGSLFDAS